MARRVIVRDLGFNALQRRLGKTRTLAVTVGVHADDGSVAHQNAQGATVAAIGLFHEFGAGVPMRSWLRAPVDASESEIKAAMRRVGRGIVSNRRRLDPASGMDFIGQFVLQRVKAHMTAGIPASDGPPRTLIDTSQFFDSIKHKVASR